MTKEVKDFYAENYETLIKEIENGQRYGKISHALGSEESMLLKWTIKIMNEQIKLIFSLRK